MKKILILSIVAFSSFSVDAQSKKSMKNKKPLNKEAVANVKFQKIEAGKKMGRDSVLVAMRLGDSIRYAMDSVSDAQKDSMSLVNNTEALSAINIATKAKYEAISSDRISSEKSEALQDAMVTSSNIHGTKLSLVKTINKTYIDKAMLVQKNSDDIQKTQSLIALNIARRNELKSILGQSKERKLEKARLAYIAKNGSNTDTAWMDLQEQIAKK